MNGRETIEKSAEDLRQKLTEKGLDLRVAESFTGGLIASALTQRAGASEFFSEGLVCYSAVSKMHRLGVERRVFDDFGAVSFTCINQMLSGISGERTLAIATTGNAGPSAQNGEVGVCFVGAMINSTAIIKRFKFEGEREDIIVCGAAEAMHLATELLNKNI